MTNIVAKLEIKGMNGLTYINPIQVNNGRNDGVNFYVNADFVNVFCWHRKLSVEEQTNLLNWFLDGFKYELIELN
jgi:hypothetical protein